jgi:putative membrane protein
MKLSLIFKGMAMGIAEVIPGVSGGTIAFITGIYKELIDTIKSFDISAIKLLLTGDFNGLFKKINFSFLLFLLLGMVGGIVVGVFGVTHLLENNPEVLWAFFFGLILASVPMMLQTIKNKTVLTWIVFLVGAVVAFIITSLSPAEASTSYPYIFISGMIGIVALVLPGVSGSFILLLLGMYTFIIPTVKSFLSGPNSTDFLVLAVFGMGCLTGLLFFVRLVSKAFEKHYNITVAVMSGFMLGSLNKIWPWRNVETYLNKTTNQIINAAETPVELSTDNIKIITEQNVFPSNYLSDPKLLLVIISLVLGLVVIALLNKYQAKD